MSRIVSGKMRLEIERVDLPTAIASAIESIRPAADAKDIRIERVIDPDARAIQADPGRLHQIVWNLLSNAVKFTPPRGRVEVALARVETHVEIRVTDTGEGIAAEFLPHVFERFRQADASPARSHGGLGIGLSLVKQLAELHGGRVRAASSGPGKGSTFVVELPLAARSENTPVEPRATPAPAARATSVRLHGIRVLLVDDEPDAVVVVHRLLEEHGARVVTATSSDEALVLLDREAFDVLVSDIGMPIRDGYALIAEVRARGLAIPALALTAFARAEDRVRALDSGYQAHVAKPVQSAELLAAVATLVDRTSAAAR
jgi:CheY-like chemotaxis protein/two-component sensor histidine kinase